VLHVGHLRQDRNLLCLARVQNDSAKQVVILGGTTMRADLSLVSALQAADCIVRNDYIPAVQEYYQAADCYVFPTVEAKAAIATPLSVLEAMASNLPVVTTPFGGLPDMFRPGHGLKFIGVEALPKPASIIDAMVPGHIVRTREQVLRYDWGVVVSRLLDQYHAVRGH